MTAPATLREGLPVETQERLLQIISPRSPENPWPKKAVRVRNQLFIHMLLHLGFRRNELLALRMEEIDLPGNKVLISASPKTLGRVLSFNEHFAKLIHNYITKTRSKIKGAENNPLLFVSTSDGQPMSLLAEANIFITLRKHPDMPKKISAYVLRRTWNENFSRFCDTNSIPREGEIRLRKYLTGSPSDRTAQSYTVRKMLFE